MADEAANEVADEVEALGGITQAGPHKRVCLGKREERQGMGGARLICVHIYD